MGWQFLVETSMEILLASDGDYLQWRWMRCSRSHSVLIVLMLQTSCQLRKEAIILTQRSQPDSGWWFAYQNVVYTDQSPEHHFKYHRKYLSQYLPQVEYIDKSQADNSCPLSLLPKIPQKVPNWHLLDYHNGYTLAIMWCKRRFKNPRRLIPVYLVWGMDEKRNTDNTKLAESISTE